ncbi:MAG: hypothetical protein HKP12_08040 [Gammaproteobacteria bacterium]|nr:hypothetical protein [Gammaproteobacteria bacterium]
MSIFHIWTVRNSVPGFEQGFLSDLVSLTITIGKHDSVSDCCGEKLNDLFVADVIDSVVAGSTSRIVS